MAIDILGFIKGKLQKFEQQAQANQVIRNTADRIAGLNKAYIEKVATPLAKAPSSVIGLGSPSPVNLVRFTPKQFVEGAINAQKFIESPESTVKLIRPVLEKGMPFLKPSSERGFIPIPQPLVKPLAKIQKPIEGAKNMAAGFAEYAPSIYAQGIVDPSLDLGKILGYGLTGRGIPKYSELKSAPFKTGYQIGAKINPASGKQAGVKGNWQEFAANLAGVADPIVKQAFLEGVFNAGGKVSLETTKQVLWKIAKDSAIKQGQFGFLEGLSQGLQNAKDEKDLAKYITQVATTTGTQTALYSAIGLLTPYASFNGQKLMKYLKENPINVGLSVKDINKMTPEERQAYEVKAQANISKQVKEPFYTPDNLPSYPDIDAAEASGALSPQEAETLRGLVGDTEKQQAIKAMGAKEKSLSELEGWPDGLKHDFDQALYKKDAETLKKLMPFIPDDYKQKFAPEIQEVLGGQAGLYDVTQKVLPVKNVNIGKTTYKLPEILDNPKLYEKYPELKGMNIHLGSGVGRETGGMVSKGNILLNKDSYEFVPNKAKIDQLNKKLEPFLKKESAGTLTKEEYNAAAKITDEIGALKNGKDAVGVKLTKDGLTTLVHELEHAKQEITGTVGNVTPDFLSKNAKGASQEKYFTDSREIAARNAEEKYVNQYLGNVAQQPLSDVPNMGGVGDLADVKTRLLNVQSRFNEVDRTAIKNAKTAEDLAPYLRQLDGGSLAKFFSSGRGEAKIKSPQISALPSPTEGVSPPQAQKGVSPTDFEKEMNAISESGFPASPADIKVAVDEGKISKEVQQMYQEDAQIKGVTQMLKKPPKLNSVEMSEAQKQADIAQINAEGKKREFKMVISDWLGKNRNASIEGYQFGKQFDKLSDKDALEFINGVESGDIPPKFEKLADQYRALDDQIYQKATESGIDVNYLKNHVAHIWKESPQEVRSRFVAFKRKYEFANERTVPTYEEGVKMGLTPRFNSPQAILGYQYQQLLKTLNGIDAFQQLQDEGLIVPASVGYKREGFLPIKNAGFPTSESTIGKQTIVGNWYAPEDIAKNIDKIFGPKDVMPILKTTSNLSGKVQDITMSGGIPGTPVNNWAFMQGVKEVLAGRVRSPIKALFANDKFIEEKIPVIKRMQLNDVPVNTKMNVYDLEAPSTVGEQAGSLWNKLVNDPTFKRFAPALQINFFEDVSNQMQAKGMSQEEADAIAAIATKNWSGTPGTLAYAERNPNLQAGIQAAFFAPRYRESIVNFWFNSIKGLKNPLAPTNIANTKFLAGAGLLLGAMNFLNEKFNGHGMKDNAPGLEDKLVIPLSQILSPGSKWSQILNPDGKQVVAVPWLSSIATMPRLAVRVGGNLLKGEPGMAAQDIGRTIPSQLLKPIFDISANESYYGKPIVQGNEPPSEKWLKYAKYYGGQFNHPYLREVLDSQNTGDPAYQRISRALELPFRFYTQNQIDSKYYFKNVDQITKGFDSNDRAIWGTIHPQKKDIQGNLLYEPGVINSVQKASLYLNNPKIETAEVVLAQLQKQQGKATDPIWDLNVNQRHLVWAAQVKLPGQKSDYSKMLYGSDWYPQYSIARTAFFDSLGLGQSTGLQAPQPSARAEALMRAKQWRDPEVQAYLQANDAYNDRRLAMMGLPSVNNQTGYGGYNNYPKVKKGKVAGIPKSKKLKAVKVKFPKLAKSKGMKKIAQTSLKPKNTSLKLLTYKQPKFYKVAKA